MRRCEPHPAPAFTFSVGSFNVHAGVDGWGRPFDVIGACRQIDADVLLLEENWAPDGGASIARQVGDAMGYVVVEHHLAGGRLAGPHPGADEHWMRSFDWRGKSHAIFLDSERPFSAQVRGSRRFEDAQRGHWGIAVLIRLPVIGSSILELGRLARDRARRAALAVTIDAGGTSVTVIGTHMSHITYGAPRQFASLAKEIRTLLPDGPVVLAGDMNLWGPPVSLFFPRWRRALRHKTWPAWRPHSQVDHVLVRGPLRVVAADALCAAGSDHLPIRVTLAPLAPPT